MQDVGILFKALYNEYIHTALNSIALVIFIPHDTQLFIISGTVLHAPSWRSLQLPFLLFLFLLETVHKSTKTERLGNSEQQTGKNMSKVKTKNTKTHG